MTDAVASSTAFNPLTYLTQLKSATPLTTTTLSTTDTPNPVASNTVDSSDTSSTSTQSNSPVQLSSSLISLLQETSSSSTGAGTLSSLFSSSAISSTTDPLAGLYTALGSQDSSNLPAIQALAAAQQQQAQSTASTDSSAIQNLLSQYNAATNAYTNTNIQNAQSVISANTQPIVA